MDTQLKRDIPAQRERAPFHIFRRASLDQIPFCKPPASTPSSQEGAPRPASAYARTNEPRPLSNIPELSPCSHDAEDPGKPEGRRFGKSISGRDNQKAAEVTQAARHLQLCHSDTSTTSLPLGRVPARRSSMACLRNPRISKEIGHQADGAAPLGHNGRPSLLGPSGRHRPGLGKSISPVRALLDRMRSPSSYGERRAIWREFTRTIMPMDIVEVPELKEPRFSLSLRLASPIFMGGASLEGRVSVTVDGGKSKSRTPVLPAVLLGRLTIDLVGVEKCRGRRHIFQRLALELVDESYLPPPAMGADSRSLGGFYREVVPSNTIIPFRTKLPVVMGPPQYKSRSAEVQYLACVTAALKIGERSCSARTSQDLNILTAHDPEKVLVNLPTPLVASDALQYTQNKSSCELKLSAGVHRQTWVSGAPLYVEVLVSNYTTKTVKKIELLLEKITSLYHHSAAATDVSSGDLRRLPDRTERQIVARRCTKAASRMARHGWPGLAPQSQDESTCALDVPTGLVTVETGRFFSVRFFLTVQISLGGRKTLSVQLPIHIIHPNSLDIPPKSLAQVAHSLEKANQRRKERHSSASDDARAAEGASADAKQVNGGRKYNQASAYNIARRKSLDQKHQAEGKGARSRSATAHTARHFSSREHLPRVSFEPLSVPGLLLPPSNPNSISRPAPKLKSKLAPKPPPIPARHKAKPGPGQSRRAPPAGLTEGQVESLTRQLDGSPRKYARRPLLMQDTIPPVEAAPVAGRTAQKSAPERTPIMARARPRSRAVSEVGWEQKGSAETRRMSRMDRGGTQSQDVQGSFGRYAEEAAEGVKEERPAAWKGRTRKGGWRHVSAHSGVGSGQREKDEGWEDVPDHDAITSFEDVILDAGPGPDLGRDDRETFVFPKPPRHSAAQPATHHSDLAFVPGSQHPSQKLVSVGPPKPPDAPLHRAQPAAAAGRRMTRQSARRVPGGSHGGERASRVFTKGTIPEWDRYPAWSGSGGGAGSVSKHARGSSRAGSGNPFFHGSERGFGTGGGVGAETVIVKRKPVSVAGSGASASVASDENAAPVRVGQVGRMVHSRQGTQGVFERESGETSTTKSTGDDDGEDDDDEDDDDEQEATQGEQVTQCLSADAPAPEPVQLARPPAAEFSARMRDWRRGWQQVQREDAQAHNARADAKTGGLQFVTARPAQQLSARAKAPLIKDFTAVEAEEEVVVESKIEAGRKNGVEEGFVERRGRGKVAERERDMVSVPAPLVVREGRGMAMAGQGMEAGRKDAEREKVREWETGVGYGRVMQRRREWLEGLGRAG